MAGWKPAPLRFKMNTPATNSFQIIRRDELAPTQVDAMFELLAHHFNGVTRTQFERDLAARNRVILILRDGRLVGFSTLLAYTTGFEGERINVIYSGDTIVAPEAWGTTALPRAWVAAVDELRGTMPEGRCYWLLLTSGFRTYRFLPVFWREFYPRFDRATPPTLQRLLNQLAVEQFGEQFNPASGIVRFNHPQKLAGGLNQIAEGRTSDVDVAFFVARNPGHASGDELVCLTELCPANLTAAGRRMQSVVGQASRLSAGAINGEPSRPQVEMSEYGSNCCRAKDSEADRAQAGIAHRTGETPVPLQPPADL